MRSRYFATGKGLSSDTTNSFGKDLVRTGSFEEDNIVSISDHFHRQPLKVYDGKITHTSFSFRASYLVRRRCSFSGVIARTFTWAVVKSFVINKCLQKGA